VRLTWSEGPGAGAGGARGARGARGAGGAAGAVRAGPGYYVAVAARWLQQRGCHIDVAGAAIGAGPAGAGAAGAPDEVPTACDTSVLSPGLSLSKSPARRGPGVVAGGGARACGGGRDGRGRCAEWGVRERPTADRVPAGRGLTLEEPHPCYMGVALPE